MVRATYGFGISLILISVVSLFLTDYHFTIFIPGGFGIFVLLLGFVAKRESLRKHALHGAVLLALLMILSTGRSPLKALTLLSGGEVQRPAAVIAQFAAFSFSLVYMVLAIRSFIEARKAKV